MGTGMSEDSLLVERVRQGDKAAFSALVESYQTPVYNLAYRMLGNADEAEDATQESFLRAYTRLGSYNNTKPFKTWLFAIAAHHCIDRLRKRRLIWLSLDTTLPPHPALSDSRPGPEESAVQSERQEMVQQMLNTLKPKDRIMVILRYWYDHSYEEIAEVTGASVSAVKSRLHRARNALAESMSERQAVSQPAALVEG